MSKESPKKRIMDVYEFGVNDSMAATEKTYPAGLGVFGSFFAFEQGSPCLFTVSIWRVFFFFF